MNETNDCVVLNSDDSQTFLVIKDSKSEMNNENQDKDDEVVYILQPDQQIDDDSHKKIDEPEHEEDTMLYVVDGEKVVLVGKRFLVNDDTADIDKNIRVKMISDSAVINDGNKVTSTKKGVKRKRDVLLKTSEDRCAPKISLVQNVVRTREVQLFTRDELVELPYCPEYDAEEVVLAETQEKIPGRRRKKVKNQMNYNRSIPVSIRPKVEAIRSSNSDAVTINSSNQSPVTLSQSHFLEPFLAGRSTVGSHLSYSLPGSKVSAKNMEKVQNHTQEVNTLISDNKSYHRASRFLPELKPLQPKPIVKSEGEVIRLASSQCNIKASALTQIRNAGNGYKVLKNVDIVVKTEPFDFSHQNTNLPQITHSPVKSTSSVGLKVAIPKYGHQKTPSTNIDINQTTDKKSILIQKKLDAMLRISPNASLDSQSTKRNWETISKDLERCNYPKLKNYVMEQHRWLWQFMKELFDRHDPCLEWRNIHDGIFALMDMERLGQLWENYKIITNQSKKAQCWRQLRYYFSMVDDSRIIRQIPLGGGNVVYQFRTLFYKERFNHYNYKPFANFKDLEKDIPNISSIIKPLASDIPALFCSKGCGSQFRKVEALSRHEKVCTHIQS